jgi:hypothetical protein
MANSIESVAIESKKIETKAQELSNNTRNTMTNALALIKHIDNNFFKTGDSHNLSRHCNLWIALLSKTIETMEGGLGNEPELKDLKKLIQEANTYLTSIKFPSNIKSSDYEKHAGKVEKNKNTATENDIVRLLIERIQLLESIRST